MDYSFTGQVSDPSISVVLSSDAESAVPTLGPEIGPDPRNAVATVRLPDEPSMDAGNGVWYDFANGFRVMSPAAPGEYEIIVWNLDTGTVIFRSAMPPGTLAVGSRKYYIRYRIELSDHSAGRLLARIDFDCTDRDVLISVPDGGLGDNIAWMPYAEEFRVTHKARVTCACGEWLIRLVKDQYPELRFVPIGEKPDSSRYYAVYYCAVFGRDRPDWRPLTHQHYGMQGTVAAILGVPYRPLKTRFRLDAPRTVAEPYVVISAMASNPCKHWNWPGGWDLLCRYLKRLGYRVFVIDREKEQLFGDIRCTVPSEAEDLTGAKPIAERIALLRHADFFVGLPSGLSWLAWCCNVPVVMISGFTEDGSEFPTPYRVFNPDFCHGCWNDTGCFFDTKVPVWCPRHAGTPRVIECTRAITPKMVIGTVNRIPAVQARLAARPPVRISLIIPVTRVRYVRKAVESAVAAFASYGRTEILIRNDGSKEPSLVEMLDALAAEYPDMVRVFNDFENLGAAQARNFLVERSQGDYLVFFDDDDVMLPFDVGRVVAFLDAHPEVEADYAPKYVFDDENGYRNEVHGAEWSDFAAFYSPQVNLSALFIRRTAFDAVGGFKDVKGDAHAGLEDAYLFLRLAERAPLHFDPEPRSLYRIHPINRLSAAVPGWYDWMTEQMCAKHPAIVCRLLEGDTSDLKGPEGRLALMLTGAVAYLHQREPAVCRPLFEAALQAAPDDHGITAFYMSLLRHLREYDRLEAYADEALARFADCPRQQFVALHELLTSYGDRPLASPDGLVRRVQEVHARWTALPAGIEEQILAARGVVFVHKNSVQYHQ